jgi:hypothetical protein
MRRKGHVISVHYVRRPTPTHYYSFVWKNVQIPLILPICACRRWPEACIIASTGAAVTRAATLNYTE